MINECPPFSELIVGKGAGELKEMAAGKMFLLLDTVDARLSSVARMRVHCVIRFRKATGKVATSAHGIRVTDSGLSKIAGHTGTKAGDALNEIHRLSSQMQDLQNAADSFLNGIRAA